MPSLTRSPNAPVSGGGLSGNPTTAAPLLATAMQLPVTPQLSEGQPNA